MKNKGLLIVLGLIALIAAIKIFGGKKNETPAAFMSGPSKPMTVSGIIIKSESFNDEVSVPGSLLAFEEVELKPEASGKVVFLNIQEGSKVQKGQLLLKLNDQDLKAQLEKQKALIKLAEDKLGRQKKLLELKAVSQEEYDVSFNQVSNLKADLAVLNAQIAKSEIIAPFDGTVGLKYISIGSYVSPSTKIALLQDIDPIKVEFSLPEKYLSRVNSGQTVHFTVEGRDSVFAAKIYAVESRIDPATRSFTARAQCPNTQKLLTPGSFATVKIGLTTINGAVLIPTEAVIPELKGQKVFVSRNGKAAPVKIEAGVRTENRILVKKGLQEGDTLITSGMMQLKPDAPVKVIVK